MARQRALAAPTCAADIPEDFFLGQIVAFTISGATVNLEAMRAQLVEYGLRADLLKTKLRRIDAFKKATNDIPTRFTRYDDHQDALVVRAVGQDTNEAHRHVLLEQATWRSGRRREIRSILLYKIAYDRGERQPDGTVRDDHIAIEQQIVSGLVLTTEQQRWIAHAIGKDGAGLRRRFNGYSNNLDSHGIRTFIRDYLRALDAINVKGSNSGGLYFVPQRAAREAGMLAEFVRSMGSSMRLIPLVDTPEQREMLSEAFVADILDTSKTLTAEVSKILKQARRKITEETYRSYVDKIELLLAMQSDYEDLLGRELGQASAELAATQLKVNHLESRVHRPKTLTRKR